MEFPATQWTLLAQATVHGDSSAADAMAEFIRRYRGPVVQFIRGRGWPADESEDLAQDFLIHVMEKSTLRRADEKRGRFRSFLLGALVRFLHEARDRRVAQKRGGDTRLLHLDAGESSADLPVSLPPEAAAFDRHWALALLASAVQAVESEYVARGRGAAFVVLRAYLPGGVLPPPYEASAQRLGLDPAAFKTEVHRLRKRFRDRLREQIAATVTGTDEIEAEFQHLRRALQVAAT